MPGPKAPIDELTAARLRAALGALARQLRRTAAGAGLTPTELSVLATLTRSGRSRLTELAREQGINPTMLSRIAAKLARARPDRARARRRRPPRRARRGDAGRHGAATARSRPSGRRACAAHVAEALEPSQAAALVAALPALEALGELLRDAERMAGRWR